MKKTAALIFCAVLVLTLIAGCKKKGTVIDTKGNGSLTSDTVSNNPSGSSESTGSDVVIDVDDKNDDWGDVIIDVEDGDKGKDKDKDKDKDKSPLSSSQSSSGSTSSSGSSSNSSSSKPYDDKDQGFGPWV
ncbi:MAG: hypothetical protein ACLU40_01955 [Acutalibacteraceae bacterium]